MSNTSDFYLIQADKCATDAAAKAEANADAG
jgi:hypothetical protein